MPCAPSDRPILPPVLDIRQLRENPDHIRERLATREEEFAAKVDDVVRLDTERREAITAVEELKAKRNAASKEIGALMGQKKSRKPRQKRPKCATSATRFPSWTPRPVRWTPTCGTFCCGCPICLMPTFRSVRLKRTTPRSAYGARNRHSILSQNRTRRFASRLASSTSPGAPSSGSGFLLYSGWGARLERALIQYLLDMHVHEHGYTEVSPPFMVGYDCMIGVGHLPKFEDQAYMVQEGLDEESRGKLYLIPTAEGRAGRQHPSRGDFKKRGAATRNITAPTARASEPRPAQPGSAPVA